MSRSKRFPAVIPQPIADALDLDYKKCGYRSRNAMIVGLARYHLLIGKPHPVTVGIENMPLDHQDMIDDFLLEITKRGITIKGQFLTRLISNVLNGDNYGTEDIPSLLPGALLKMATRWKAEEDVWKELQQ